ncbi:MAG TPA: diphosphomevalonate decarboxylase [Thermoplasmata archaeon]|nr:diphosphomevalonate decarboxylase [Thermoplasmata archaeon]
MVTAKATAIAHPIQGLIKYHGLVDERLRLPFHDSISVCTAPLATRTTIEFGDFPEDAATINGKVVAGHELERILAVVDVVRIRAKLHAAFRMASVNDFPSNVGLGASASGFAALGWAACAAAGLPLETKDVSRIARRGAGSASRAVAGGFARWRTGTADEDSYAYQLRDDLDMGIIVALVPAYKETESAHREAPSSPFFQARLAEMPKMLAEMELAVRNGDLGQVMTLAERDTMMLHGITMTGTSEMMLWRPETIKVILAVKRMREEGVPAFFSIDTGATVYVNTFPEKAEEVEARIRALGVETLRCRVGGGARTTDDHLF